MLTMIGLPGWREHRVRESDSRRLVTSLSHSSASSIALSVSYYHMSDQAWESSSLTGYQGALQALRLVPPTPSATPVEPRDIMDETWQGTLELPDRTRVRR